MFYFLKKIRVKIMVIIALMIISCGSIGRSTRPLEPGEILISYTFPMTETARVGLNNNMELRYVNVWGISMLDAYYHSNYKNFPVNWGVTYGGMFLLETEEFENMGDYFSLTLGTDYRDRFYPYISITQYGFFSEHLKFDSWSQVYNIGCETVFFKGNSLSLFITPEYVNFGPDSFVEHESGYFNNPVFTLSLGFSYRLNRK